MTRFYRGSTVTSTTALPVEKGKRRIEEAEDEDDGDEDEDEEMDEEDDDDDVSKAHIPRPPPSNLRFFAGRR